MSQGRSRFRRIAAQPVFGRCLNQRRHRVTARDACRQRIVGITGVQLGSLLVAAEGRFKLSIREELAGGKIELGSATPVGAAYRPGQANVLSRFGVLTLRSGLSGDGRRLCRLGLDRLCVPGACSHCQQQGCRDCWKTLPSGKPRDDSWQKINQISGGICP
jgi:hypothetical protein